MHSAAHQGALEMSNPKTKAWLEFRYKYKQSKWSFRLLDRRGKLREVDQGKNGKGGLFNKVCYADLSQSPLGGQLLANPALPT